MYRVHENGRFLTRKDGTPFFYLGDTAWELFHRLDREEADDYLSDRAAKGFTVIQAVALAEQDGLETPNVYGDMPLENNDPTRPNEAYWMHVDYVVRKANALGLIVGLLPTWGDKWNKTWGKGPEVFTPENARVYSAFVGSRYKNDDVLWILGGDRRVQTMNHVRIIRAMAEGIKTGDEGRHLMTFHPQGQETASQYFHCDEWLDFTTCQTGHTFDRDNWRTVAADYARTPIKPCLDSEPGYEDHPNGWKPETGWLDDYECRKFLYWAVFAGACGHTYGCHDVWQMLSPKFPPVSNGRTPWREALHLPGASQMQYAKQVLLARPYFDRVPDQSLIVSDTFDGPLHRTHHIQATRDKNGRFALVYSASGQPFTVKMDKLAGTVEATWINPRDGKAEMFAQFEAAGERSFIPPSNGRGHDWVLALDVV